MERNFIEKATFTEVYRFLKDKPDNEIFQCFNSLFGVALLFFPALMCRDTAMITEIATGATLAGAGAGAIVGNAAKNAFALFQKKDHSDYGTRYEQMQIAQVMLVYAAYFDTISQCLPDENGEISITSDIKRKISQEGLQAYFKKMEESARQKRSMPKLFENELALPDPTQPFSGYKKELRRFYEALNSEFTKFFDELSFWKELVQSQDSIDREQREFFSDLLSGLPQKALSTYEKQYFELAKEFPEFEIWANHTEHDRFAVQIDVGFKEIREELNQLRQHIADSGSEVFETLMHYQTRYADYIREPVIEHKKNGFAEKIIFPSKKDIFIPQAFQSLTYHKDMRLEQNDTWEKAFSGEDIGRYVSSVLRHPKYGESPMLILGLPGAGKTLLCHMLAAQILSAEYYVMIIRLRDAAAEDTIIKQIDAQIEQDFGDDCRWKDIRKASLDKPMLLIFDGYDELLQASGKTYADYLNKIAEFQELQRSTYHVIVRCIVTSRVTLIDKASIPDNCHVLRLCDFDDERISIWSEIWNQANASYFAEHQLHRFEIVSSGKIREMAGQPLLLLMLALYEMNGNRLEEEKDISRAELYYKLIWDFVVREKEKESSFRQLEKRKQEDAVRTGFRYLGIAALGMYNRRKLYIRTNELNRDIAFLIKEKSSFDETDENALEEGEQLVGSFFFIHSSKSTIQTNNGQTQIAAYEFLHNTFGEFLTAYYILDTTFRLIKRQLRDEEEGEMFSWPEKLKKEWHTSLAYAPLFTRPVVLNMIYELSGIMAEKHGIDAVKARTALDCLFKKEIQSIITGDIFADLNGTLNMQGNPLRHPELMLHVASYSVNLILLRMTVCSGYFIFTDKIGSIADWKKLTHIWRYAFSEEELVRLSCFLNLEHTDQWYKLAYQYDEKAEDRTAAFSKLDKMCRISNALGEDAAYAVFCAADGSVNQNVYNILEKEKIRMGTQCALREVAECLLVFEINESKLANSLDNLRSCCEKEGDAFGMYIYCSLLRALIDRHEMSKRYLTRLLNKYIFRYLNHSLIEEEHSRRWIFLGMIFREIFRCIYSLPSQERIELLQEFMEYYSYEIRCFQNGMCYMKDIRRSISDSFLLFCKAMQSEIKKSRYKHLGEIYYEFIRRIVQDREFIRENLSWRARTEGIRVCQALKEIGEEKYSIQAFGIFIQQISPKFGGVIPKESERSFFFALIECSYCMMKGSENGALMIYGQLIEPFFERVDIVRTLMPSDEKFLYSLLCMVYDIRSKTDYVMTINWIFELLCGVRDYGKKMSRRTLEKIKEYAVLEENQELMLAVENV